MNRPCLAVADPHDFDVHRLPAEGAWGFSDARLWLRMAADDMDVNVRLNRSSLIDLVDELSKHVDEFANDEINRRINLRYTAGVRRMLDPRPELDMRYAYRFQMGT